MEERVDPATLLDETMEMRHQSKKAFDYVLSQIRVVKALLREAPLVVGEYREGDLILFPKKKHGAQGYDATEDRQRASLVLNMLLNMCVELYAQVPVETSERRTIARASISACT